MYSKSDLLLVCFDKCLDALILLFSCVIISILVAFKNLNDLVKVCPSESHGLQLWAGVADLFACHLSNLIERVLQWTLFGQYCLPGLIDLSYFDIQQCIENFDHLFLGVVYELIKSFDIKKCELFGFVAVKGFVGEHVLEN